MNKHYEILEGDPVMKKIISATGRLKNHKNNDLYFALLKSITSQQLSTKAGDTIFGRFLDLFPDRDPIAKKLIKINIEKLRAAGLSYAKAGYLKNIAEFSITHGLEYTKLKKLEDEELIKYLTTIKGVGRWTAEMILMFSLNRPDILPMDDLGIRQSIIQHYKLKGEGKSLNQSILLIAEKWRPHRTLACRHLWKYRDTVKI